jgi:hypothetical protein
VSGRCWERNMGGARLAATRQCLEGSRFNACANCWRQSALSRVRPGNVKAGGSRELPSTIFSPGVSVREANRATKRRVISWEPPALTRFGQASDRANLAWSKAYALKRLPSSHCRAAASIYQCCQPSRSFSLVHIVGVEFRASLASIHED